ncbi:MAG: tRNA 2-thiouridine(34) synthase MnmA [Candidatus Paceibacterota bacterium]
MVTKAKKLKVMVGLSGGVDSAVSAALLQKSGHDVTGVFIKVWQPDWIECNWKEERLEAMRVAAHLGIPFFTLDLEAEYKREVIDYMIREYRSGRTPNPDVMCNRYVKFGAFWKWAQEQGADYIATGHYARVEQVAEVKPLQDKSYQLLAGLDPNKDQSYFLWTLNQKDLEHVLFPVGHLQKFEVRKLARKFKLPNAEKKDSQGLCFIGKVNIKEFLSHYLETKPGNVLNEKGEVIGHHRGALLFTNGERHGFTVTVNSPLIGKYYVIDKDVERNTITVSNKDKSNILPGGEKTVRIGNINWVSGEVPLSRSRGPTSGYALQARSRYREPLQNIKIAEVKIGQITLEFQNLQESLTPGQSLVIYDGEACLGGGVIE